MKMLLGVVVWVISAGSLYADSARALPGAASAIVQSAATDPAAAAELPAGVFPDAQASTQPQPRTIVAAAQALTPDGVADMRRRADAGDVEAQLVLAIAYTEGISVERDLARAFAWLQKAGESGHPMAQTGLAQFYARGEVVARDETRAVVFARRAADQGYATAQNMLGVAYQQGIGVPRDPAAALSWYRKAANQGNVDAQNNLAKAYDHGIGVRVDHTESARWWRAAADQGDPEAQFNLAMAYYRGEGVPRSGDECRAWLEKASDQGYAAGTFYVGKYHAEHPGFAAGSLAQDVADDYFEKSAQQGYALGALVMARRERDREAACRWLLIASALEQRPEWREQWAVERPWDAEELRRDLPKTLKDARKKLSPAQVSSCEQAAQAFMTAYRMK